MKKFFEIFMRILFLLCACLSVFAIIMICRFIFANAFPAIKEIGLLSFIFGNEWKPKQELSGIFPMIVGSIYVTVGAIVIGVPLGVFTAVFLTDYCPSGLYRAVKPMINLLASVPSIIYGFFFLVVVIPIMQKITNTSGKGVLTASILLGIMILPTIINTSEAAIKAVPKQYAEGALALGATKERSIFKTVLPAAKSGKSALCAPAVPAERVFARGSGLSLFFRDICAAAGAARGSGPGAYNAMSPRATPGSERDMFHWALQVPTKP